MTVKNYSVFEGNLTASKKVLNDILCDLNMLVTKLDANDAYRDVLQKKCDAIYDALDNAGYYDSIS